MDIDDISRPDGSIAEQLTRFLETMDAKGATSVEVVECAESVASRLPPAELVRWFTFVLERDDTPEGARAELLQVRERVLSGEPYSVRPAVVH
jgi:hypothetical protein